MQVQANARPRRRPVSRHPGIYYRPRADGKVAPPYEFSYSDSAGRRRWVVVHGSVVEAEARRAEMRARRLRGERLSPSRLTFEEYAKDWLGRQPLRGRSREVYGWALRQHLYPHFGRQRLSEITVDDVAEFIVLMGQKNLRGWTILSTMRPLSRIMSHAARRGDIAVNPCTQLERGERPRLDDQRAKRILTLEEMQKLIDAADNEEYRCLLELLITGGLRIGEALGLTVGDLDRRHSLVRIEYQLSREGERTTLKTEESRRSVDIPPALMRRLFGLVAERDALGDPSALVFASRNGTGLARKVAREALKRAVTTSRLSEPAPCLHDLRHSHASMLIALDVPIVDVQRRLGHRKPDTTLRVYTHQWKERETRRSVIGEQLGQMFARHRVLAAAPAVQLALPPAGDTTGW